MKLSFKTIKFIGSLLIVSFFFYLTFHYFDGEWIWKSIKAIIQSPIILFAILTAYLLSFCLKALAWKVYLNGRPRFLTCLLGVLYSLFVNHLLPIKAGDLVRMKIMSTRDDISDEEAAHSVIILRLLDMIFLIGFTSIGLFVLEVDFNLPIPLITIGSVVLVLSMVIVIRFVPAFINRQFELFKLAFSGKNGMVIAAAIGLSWILEAAVLYGTVIVYNGDLSMIEAIFANNVTVSGQIFQITPG